MEGIALTAGTVVDRYEVEGVLGMGGMATVYRVRHLALGSIHALKVLHIASRSIRDRMRQEGQLQARLAHPNIVAVTDVIELDNETPGLIMELVDGPTLESLLDKGPLPLPLADELAMGIMAGVAEAHRQGLVHRDLKPSNVLLKPMGNGFLPKVADFGLAKALTSTEASRTRSGTSMGTPHYMSPEQVRDAKNVAASSDVFALGAILYEMVTGRRAFEGSDVLEVYNAVAAASYSPVSELVKDLPARMEQAITGALQVDPARRPADVEALASLWSGRPVSAAPPVVPVMGAPPGPKPAATTQGSRAPSRLDSIEAARSVGCIGILVVLLVMSAAALGLVAFTLVFRPTRPAPPALPAVEAPLAQPAPVEAPVVAELPPELSPAEPAPPAGPRTLEDVALLARSTSPADRRAAAELLGARTDAASLEVLDALLRSEGDPTVVTMAYKAVLARYQASGGVALGDTVVWLAGTGAARHAQEATVALRRFARDPKVLLGPLGHENASVRAAAVDALPDVVRHAPPPVELGAIRKRLRNESDPVVKKRIARLPESIRG
jgi:eukaryotic-like serine/threonine-protein kinase